MQCQKTYLAEGYCKNQVFGASKWCRWHKVIEEFRADLRHYPKLAAQGLMFGASGLAYLAAYSLSMFAKHDSLIWVTVSVFFVGGSVKYFADGCIAQDHPFSQFAFWSKLLAFGLFLEIVSGSVLGYYLATNYSTAAEIARQFSLPSFLSKYGATLITAALILECSFSIRLFVNRVLFLRQPALNSLITIMMFGLMGTALRPLWLPQTPPDLGQQSHPARLSPTKQPNATEAERSWTDHYWEPALGNRYWPPLIAVLVLGFVLAEIVNKRMRSRDQAMAVFRATVWPSFPICYGGPFLGAQGARLILLWTKTHGPWLFVPAALSLDIVAVALGTHFLIRTYLANLRHAGTPVARERDRGQELALFLRVRREILGHDNFAYTAGEIQLALEYSGTGRIETYGEHQGFLLVQIAGSSAEKMFDALRDLLSGLSIGAGSFAVLRYGDRREERVIEL